MELNKPCNAGVMRSHHGPRVAYEPSRTGRDGGADRLLLASGQVMGGSYCVLLPVMRSDVG